MKTFIGRVLYTFKFRFYHNPHNSKKSPELPEYSKSIIDLYFSKK